MTINIDEDQKELLKHLLKNELTTLKCTGFDKITLSWYDSKAFDRAVRVMDILGQLEKED